MTFYNHYIEKAVQSGSCMWDKQYDRNDNNVIFYISLKIHKICLPFNLGALLIEFY